MAVTSSWAVIWKQPSPSTAHTVRSGRPTLAPIAAGIENPIVPSPPELTHVYGSVNLQYCDAHIWCWPTPEVEDRPFGRGVAQLLEAELRLEGVAGLARLVDERELLAPAGDPAAPGRRVGLRARRRRAGP